MSLLKWFAKKPDAPSTVPPDSSGLGQVDATLPLTHTARIAAHGKSVAEGPAASRKHERMGQRELLYSVVRDCMNGVGVLSSSYKFKVLSLDSHGRHYLIMMDLPREQVGDTGRLSEVELLIAQHAKAQHDILVTAVYWRVNEQVTSAGRPASRNVSSAARGVSGLQSSAAAAAPAATPSPSANAPLLADEMAAFKAAVGSASPRAKVARLGELVQSGPRNPLPPQFADTQIDDVAQPLSGSQYGDLT